MGYDEELAERLRALLADEPGVAEKKMFGGLAFLIEGHMAVCASGRGGLMVRLAAADCAEALSRPHASRMVMRGRELNGWILVAPDGCGDAAELQRWVDDAVTHVRTLPPK